MTIPKEEIDKLVQQAFDSVSADMRTLFDRATETIDIEAWTNKGSVSNIEFASNYALAGYMLGVRDALENIEITEE